MNVHTMNTKVGFLKGLSLVLCFIVIALFFLAMPPATVDAAPQPSGQKLSNSDFEVGNMTGWGSNGNGWVGVDSRGQHETPFWGTHDTDPPYPQWPQTYARNSWDGYVESVANGSTQLFQSFWVTPGQKYRFGAWVYTNGVPAYLERYSDSLGGLVPCASTAEVAHTLLACEFTATASEYMAFILEQGYGTGLAISDDWTLTPITTVPRWVGVQTWATLPVRFYIENDDAYPMRTRIAAWKWNDAMGRTMLQETTDPNQAGIRIQGVYDGITGPWFGDTTQEAPGLMRIRLNNYWMNGWDNTYRYGFEARESVIAHELGHALGLDDVYVNCLLMNGYSDITSWNCGVHKPTTGDVDGMRAIYPMRVFLPIVIK